jgi:hypothetical protein
MSTDASRPDGGAAPTGAVVSGEGEVIGGMDAGHQPWPSFDQPAFGETAPVFAAP